MSTINIYLFLHKDSTQKIKVGIKNKISIISQLFKEEKKIYIFNGNILQENTNFNELSIKNDDIIVVLPFEETKLFYSQLINYYLATTRDYDSFKESIHHHIKKKEYQLSYLKSLSSKFKVQNSIPIP